MKHNGGVQILIIYDKKLLLILRDDIEGISNPGCWSLPGGGIESGETPLEAAKRELLEELNVEYPLHELGTTSFGNTFFLATVNTLDPIQLGEGTEYNFFSYTDLIYMAQFGEKKEYLGGVIYRRFMKYIAYTRELLNKGIPLPPEFFM